MAAPILSHSVFGTFTPGPVISNVIRLKQLHYWLHLLRPAYWLRSWQKQYTNLEFTMKRSILTVLTALLLATFSTAQLRQDMSPENSELNATPESALRAFLFSVVSGDATVLKRVATPDKDIDWLLGGQRPPAPVVKQMKAHFDSMPIRAYKIGDEVTLPDGDKLVFDESRINANRAMLTFPDNPVPFELVRVQGKWKVNPAPLIAARKAAQAMRDKRAAGSK
jgi:hypothetical protein